MIKVGSMNDRVKRAKDQGLTISFTIRADMTYLRLALDRLRNHLPKEEYDPADQKKIEIAVEEALVNVIKHAYQDQQGHIQVIYRLIPGRCVEIVIRDRGHRFDPSQYSVPKDPDLSIEEQPIGGLGIAFIKRIMDEVVYERMGNQNSLTLKKWSPCSYPS